MSQDSISSGASLVVSNLDQRVQADHIIELFQKYRASLVRAEVEQINEDSGLFHPMTIAKVQFNDPTAASQAMQELDGFRFYGRRLKILPQRGVASDAPSVCISRTEVPGCIWVGSLPVSAHEGDIRVLFANWLNCVTEVRIMRERNPFQPSCRSFAFVNFRSKNDAFAAFHSFRRDTPYIRGVPVTMRLDMNDAYFRP